MLLVPGAWSDARIWDDTAARLRDDGLLWAPPPPQMSELQPDLSPAQRAGLAGGFVAHPGRTVLEPARVTRPVTARPATYVADTADDLPPELADGPPPGWHVEVVGGGHWAMLTRPDAVHAAVVAAVRAAGNTDDPRRPSSTGAPCTTPHYEEMSWPW